MTCKQCQLIRYVTAFPYYCQCGLVYEASGKSHKQPKQPKRQQPPQTFQTVLYEVIGCDCVPSTPRKTLPRRLSEKLKISLEQAQDLVDTAVKLHEQLSTQTGSRRHS